MDTFRARLFSFWTALSLTVLATLYFALVPEADSITDNLNDKVNHVLAFSLLALLADFSFPKTRFGVAKATSLLGFGFLIEAIQYVLPYRQFSLYDLLADGGGIVLYVFSQPLLRRIPWLQFRWQPPMLPGIRRATSPTGKNDSEPT